MIVCPNCSHQNPDGAVHCEACYTPMPRMMHCPNCQAPVQSDASFCGQCGFNLQSTAAPTNNPQSPLPPTIAVPPGGASSAPATRSPALNRSPEEPLLPPTVAIPPTQQHSQVEAPMPPTIATHPPDNSPATPDIPDLPPPEPIVQPDPLVAEVEIAEVEMSSNSEVNYSSAEPSPEKSVNTSQPQSPAASPAAPRTTPPAPVASHPTVAQTPMQSSPSQTMLQIQVARLLHVQTNTSIELPANLTVIHIGKPNDRVPPDVDVSGFPNSEIVSRVHADIRVEGDSYYIEDVGSANGTYINNMPLPVGNRHRLRPGDRVALGKGDKVTFLFQIS